MPYKNLKYVGTRYQHVKHFKTATGYRKYLAYQNIHGIKSHHHQTVIVGGKVHHPKSKRRLNALYQVQV